jgi:hypothetical protein
MNIFDPFRKKQPEPTINNTVSLPQLCYTMAYFVFPYYVFDGKTKLPSLYKETPENATFLLLFIAYKKEGIEPNADKEEFKNQVQRFQWHEGAFDNTHKFLALEYPTPPAIDMSKGMGNFVLAPYFSVILLGDTPEYFILGQSPVGGTTVRRLNKDGTNYNLGPGPKPSLENFLTTIRERTTK